MVLNPISDERQELSAEQIAVLEKIKEKVEVAGKDVVLKATAVTTLLLY